MVPGRGLTAAHRLAGHLQEGEEQQEEHGQEVQQLRERVDRLRGALRLPRPLPCARGDPAKVRPEYRPPVCKHTLRVMV